MGEENADTQNFMNMFVRAFENVGTAQQQRRIHVRFIPCTIFVTGQDFKKISKDFRKPRSCGSGSIDNSHERTANPKPRQLINIRRRNAKLNKFHGGTMACHSTN
jgi:hypothetical protein